MIASGSACFLGTCAGGFFHGLGTCLSGCGLAGLGCVKLLKVPLERSIEGATCLGGVYLLKDCVPASLKHCYGFASDTINQIHEWKQKQKQEDFDLQFQERDEKRKRLEAEHDFLLHKQQNEQDHEFRLKVLEHQYKGAQLLVQQEQFLVQATSQAIGDQKSDNRGRKWPWHKSSTPKAPSDLDQLVLQNQARFRQLGMPGSEACARHPSAPTTHLMIMGEQACTENVKPGWKRMLKNPLKKRAAPLEQ